MQVSLDLTDVCFPIPSTPRLISAPCPGVTEAARGRDRDIPLVRAGNYAARRQYACSGPPMRQPHPRRATATVKLAGSTLLVALLLVTSGCISNPTAPPTDNTDDTGDESKAKEIIDRIKENQRQIQSYRATSVRTTRLELSNGSTLISVEKHERAVEYGADATLIRDELSAGGWTLASNGAPEPALMQITVHNETNTSTYTADEHVYHVEPREPRADQPRSYAKYGERIRTSFSTLLRENDATYRGTENVNGRDAYVLTFEATAHPNGPESTPTAYYSTQTFWYDTETGLLLKHTATKPPVGNQMSLQERRNPEQRHQTTTNEDAVYPETKTHTTIYRNITVNSEFSADTFTLDPPENATRATS